MPYAVCYYQILGVSYTLEKAKTWKPTTAGVLIIASSIYGISVGAAMTTSFSFHPILTDVVAIVALLRVAFMVLGGIAFVGGIIAIQREHWGWALMGAIVSLPLLPVGTALGILSLILLIKSKREFV